MQKEQSRREKDEWMANASDNAGSRNSGLNYGKGLICIVIRYSTAIFLNQFSCPPPRGILHLTLECSKLPIRYGNARRSAPKSLSSNYSSPFLPNSFSSTGMRRGTEQQGIEILLLTS